jgi:hypothetical protein
LLGSFNESLKPLLELLRDVKGVNWACSEYCIRKGRITSDLRVNKLKDNTVV